mmetsp:Transcript_7116/g.15430  ORF Transcript_7116/g.15430 Transcript_7116/m.15430 type:complete len:116 (+) Transcript_7116:461-808(+)
MVLLRFLLSEEQKKNGKQQKRSRCSQSRGERKDVGCQKGSWVVFRGWGKILASTPATKQSYFETRIFFIITWFNRKTVPNFYTLILWFQLFSIPHFCHLLRLYNLYPLMREDWGS